jgi:hypothetical protein
MQCGQDAWKCLYCGGAVQIPRDAVPEVVYIAASGKPTYRILMFRGEEVHRCEVADR